MAYNMGPDFLNKFPKAAAHLSKGDYMSAGSEFLDSKYAEQVGQRAVDNAALLAGTPNINTPQGLVPNPTVVPGNEVQQQANIAAMFSGLGNIQSTIPASQLDTSGLAALTPAQIESDLATNLAPA